MKALSIRQPWAWLIVRPDLTDRSAIPAGVLKDIENRDWATKHRGPLLIHAAQTKEPGAWDWVYRNVPEVVRCDGVAGWVRVTIERGGIVGRANLVDVVTAHPSRWFQGTYGFVLEDAEPLPFHPCRGMPGLFEVDYPAPGEEASE